MIKKKLKSKLGQGKPFRLYYTPILVVAMFIHVELNKVVRSFTVLKTLLTNQKKKIKKLIIH
jgi:hypothetical protein